MEQLLKDDLSEFSAVNKKNLNELVSLVEELVINKVKIENMKSEFSNNALSKILDQELRIISQIQDSIKKVRLVKLKTITDSLTDLVNQHCNEYNVNTQFIFEGQETEIENSLIHYLHRILISYINDIFKSQFDTSKDNSKYIKIQSSSDGKNLTTVIENNGRGFDYELICKTLNKKNIDLLSFNEDELRKFHSLTNTSTDIENMFKFKSDLSYLDGNVSFEAELNKFMRVTLVIPLSSSIMQGLLVTVAEQVYAVPLEFIETIINKNAVSIKKSNNTKMIVYMDHIIELISVSELLELDTNGDASCILIVNANNKNAALLVDSLLDQTDMVIKPKHPIIKDVHEIKGTTILGDGLVTLVLDIPSILKGI